jgi:hypothetical protein
MSPRPFDSGDVACLSAALDASERNIEQALRLFLAEVRTSHAKLRDVVQVMVLNEGRSPGALAPENDASQRVSSIRNVMLSQQSHDDRQEKT